MYIVYILQDNNGKLYKGVTNNLERRFNEHVKGSGSRTTSMMEGLKIIYSEKFDNFKDARLREVYFKTAAGRRFIKKIMQT